MRLLRAMAVAFVAVACGCGGNTTSNAVGGRYFIRAATYDVVNKRVVIIDPNSPRIVTLDPWPEIVFAGANGQRTVDEFVVELRKEWGPGAPADLASLVAQQLTGLVKQGLVTLLDEPRELPPYLASPQSSQNLEEMKKQMAADGFIRESK